MQTLHRRSRACVGGDAGFTETAQGSAEAAALDAGRFAWSIERGGEAAALAVVGLGEVDEFEVEAEGTGKPVCRGKVEGGDAGDGLLELRCRGVCSAAVGGLATGDGGAAKVFNGLVERLSGLLAEDVAKESPEGADVAAEGGFLEVGSVGLKLCEAVGPACGGPKRRHD